MTSLEKCLMGLEGKGDLRVPDRYLGAYKQEATLSLEIVCLMTMRYLICLELLNRIP